MKMRAVMTLENNLTTEESSLATIRSPVPRATSLARKLRRLSRRDAEYAAAHQQRPVASEPRCHGHRATAKGFHA